MTLPSSGSLDYNSIRAEFGSPSSNVYLNLYYRGGPYCVNLPENSNITTSSSGQLAVNNFYSSTGGAKVAWGTGGSYNSGGKAPVVSYGCGAIGLPNMTSQSIVIGSLATNLSRCLKSVGPLGGTEMNTGPASYQNSNMTQRAFKLYNSSAGLEGTYTTGGAAGAVGYNVPTGPGSYTQFADGLNSSVNGLPAPSDGWGTAMLSTYFIIKAT